MVKVYGVRSMECDLDVRSEVYNLGVKSIVYD